MSHIPLMRNIVQKNEDITKKNQFPAWKKYLSENQDNFMR